MKTIWRHVPQGKLGYTFKQKKQSKIPITNRKVIIKKFKAAKTPVRTDIVSEKQITARSKTMADKSYRMILGKDAAPSHIGEETIRGQSIGYKLSEKTFNREFAHHLKSGRKEIATKIRSMSSNTKGLVRPTVKRPTYTTPKFQRKHTAQWSTGEMGNNPEGLSIYGKHIKPYALNVGKPRLIQSKKLKTMKDTAAIKAYTKADKAADKIFRKTTERFGGRTLTSSTKIRSAPAHPVKVDIFKDEVRYNVKNFKLDRIDERRLINKQVRQVSDWGKDPFERPDFASDLMSGTTSRKAYKIRKKLFIKKKK